MNPGGGGEMGVSRRGHEGDSAKKAEKVSHSSSKHITTWDAIYFLEREPSEVPAW